VSGRSDFPRTLFVEVTTRCNLACPMCVKNTPGWRGGEGHMAWEVFERLAPALLHAESVILNGIGEPLLHPDLPRMITLTRARQPKDGWCGLQTNGLLLDERSAWELVQAGLDVVCLSVDGNAARLGPGSEPGPTLRLCRRPSSVHRLAG
jgi:MoaA/NifB/PqqE/SkfB family radical SAM enzyme